MFNNPIRFMYMPDAIGGALGAAAGAGGLSGVMSAVGTASPLIAAGMGLAQGVYGIIKAGKAEREMKELLAQRKAYQTPEEVFMQLQATQQNAGQGLGSDVLSYLTTNANRAFSSGIGAMTALGGNPNDVAGLFEKRVMDSMAIAGQNQNQKMANFSKYLGALGTVAENRTAEWQSRENILKDRMQAVSAAGANATQNVQGGLNTILGGLSAAGTQELYKQGLKRDKIVEEVTTPNFYNGGNALNNAFMRSFGTYGGVAPTPAIPGLQAGIYGGAGAMPGLQAGVYGR